MWQRRYVRGAFDLSGCLWTRAAQMRSRPAPTASSKGAWTSWLAARSEVDVWDCGSHMWRGEGALTGAYRTRMCATRPRGSGGAVATTKRWLRTSVAEKPARSRSASAATGHRVARGPPPDTHLDSERALLRIALFARFPLPMPPRRGVKPSRTSVSAAGAC